jgi:hypothetical protein
MIKLFSIPACIKEDEERNNIQNGQADNRHIVLELDVSPLLWLDADRKTKDFIISNELAQQYHPPKNPVLGDVTKRHPR